MSVYAVSRTRIHRDIQITRLRAFPAMGEVLVSPGAAVERDTILGQYSSRQRLRMVRVEVSGDEIAATVLVGVGQKVKREEVLAYYSYFFGLGYTEYVSPCDGEVVGISQATGQITIKESPVSLACHLPGTVLRADEAMGVYVRSRGDMASAVAGAGFARSGKLVKKVSHGSSSASPHSISPDDAGNVVLAGAFVTREFLEMCLRYRVAAVAAGSAPYRVFEWYRDLAASLDWDEFLARYWAREMKGKDVVVPGPTEIVPALVLTEGFGEVPMSQDVFDLLASHEGEDVFVDGAAALDPSTAAYLDSGPCVITSPAKGASDASCEAGEIPRTGESANPPAGGQTDGALPENLREITTGTGVRVSFITGPAAEGTVEGVPEENVVLPNGICVDGVNVVTDRGERLTVPVFNIQVTGS